MFGLFSWFLWSSVWQNLSVSLGSCKTKSILKVLNNELKYGEVARDYKLAEFSERNEGVDCLPSLAFLYLCFAMTCGIFSRVLAKPHNGLDRIFQILTSCYFLFIFYPRAFLMSQVKHLIAWCRLRAHGSAACGHQQGSPGERRLVRSLDWSNFPSCAHWA